MIYFSIIAFILSLRFFIMSWKTSDRLIGGYYMTIGTISLSSTLPQIQEVNIVLIGLSLFCFIASLCVLLARLGYQEKNDEEII
jgi:hypothetical protein